MLYNCNFKGQKGCFTQNLYFVQILYMRHTYGKSHNQNGNFYCECDKFVYQSTKGGCDC